MTPVAANTSAASYSTQARGPIPHTFNLWRGWAVEPGPGDWSLMSAHIHNVICGGRTEISSYVMRWLAHMVQHPAQPGEVAIVMRGLKGVGKGIFGKWLLRLCGQHGLHIHQRRTTSPAASPDTCAT